MSLREMKIERRLLEAEYMIDSTLAHVRNAKCDDIRPQAMARIQKALNAVRSARALIRNEMGMKQWTLFGSSNPTTNDTKPWVQPAEGKQYGGHRTPHRWRKDCEDGQRNGTSTSRGAEILEVAP